MENVTNSRKSEFTNNTGLVMQNIRASRANGFQLTDIGINLNCGKMLQLVGPNGCGKSTLLRAIAGLAPLEQGNIKFDKIKYNTQSEEWRQHIHYHGHLSGLKLCLTAFENLTFFQNIASHTQCHDDNICEHALEVFKLSELAHRPVQSLSAGQRRRVALARLVFADAPIWLLDEPFTSLDAQTILILRNIMIEHLAKNGLIIMAHHIDDVVAEKLSFRYEIAW